MLKFPANQLGEILSLTEMEVYTNIRSIKDFFFPKSENIAEFVKTKNEIAITDLRKPIQPFILYGVKPCDAEGVKILDQVFLSDPIDTFYAEKRKNATIITDACLRPEESCFCTVFGINAAEPTQGDVTTWTVDDTIYWKPITEKGTKLIEKISVGNYQLPTENQTIASNATPYFTNLKLDVFTTKKVMEIFNHPAWEKLHRTCLGCGACTFTCPTCHCYDIQDCDAGSKVNSPGEKILRHRCWDSCMYSDFTQMSHGNPRTTGLERFRQRFMHKLMYFPENNDGTFACVGCGKCVQNCPVGLNIVKVIKALGE